MSKTNKSITWHDILDIILMFVMVFLTLYAIANQYYWAIGAIVGIFTWYHSRTDRRLKQLEQELKILKEIDEIKS